MSSNILLVKNMVCHRCVLSVEDILQRTNIPFQKVLFGEIHLSDELDPKQKVVLTEELKKVGFELIDSHMTGLIEKIKLLTIQKARNEVSKEDVKLNLSAYLSDKLHYEYTHLSSMFSGVEGRTIENFFLDQRIEKAKELLIYGQMTLSEIAFELNFEDNTYFTKFFKSNAGVSPIDFRKNLNK